MQNGMENIGVNMRLYSHTVNYRFKGSIRPGLIHLHKGF